MTGKLYTNISAETHKKYENFTRHEMIDNFYRTISPALITRFKEREENVKSDIFHAYIALLRQTKPATGIAAPDPASMEAEEGPVSLLQAQVMM